MSDSDVKRWEPEDTFLGYNMKPKDDGSFVLYEHYQKDIAQLQAEVERLKTLKGDPVGSFEKHMEYMRENSQLQSELTKARELASLQSNVIAAAEMLDKQAFEKGTQNVGVIFFRMLGDALANLSNQSIPVDKDQVLPLVGMVINGVKHYFKDGSLIAGNGALVVPAEKLYYNPNN